MSIKKFPAGIYIDHKTPVKESGEIILDKNTITFSNAQRTLTFEINHLTLHFGGTAQRVIYISDPTQNHIRLHTTDFELLNHTAFQNHPHAKNIIQQRANHHSLTILIFALIATLILIPSYFIFIERSTVSGLIASKIPFEVEEHLGNQLFKLQFAQNNNIIDDPKITKDFEALISPLTSTLQNSPYTFKIHLMKSEEANAFALPGGHIIILTGLIEQSNHPEDLLGVLAHEMAHITQRHSLKQIISELSGYILLNIITSGAGDLVFIMSDNARAFLNKSYSRTQESKADQIGFEYLLQANINPEGLIAFFKKSKDEENFINTKILKFLSTHPTNEKRIKTLENMLSKHEYEFTPIDFPYEKFKLEISQYTHSQSVETTDETDN